MLLLALFAMGTAALMMRVLPIERQMFVPPLAAIGALLGSTLVGIFQFPALAMYTLAEDAIWLALGVWIALRPGIVVVGLTLFLALAEIGGGAWQIFALDGDFAIKFASGVAVLVQGTIAVLLVRAYLKWRNRPPEDLEEVFG